MHLSSRRNYLGSERAAAAAFESSNPQVRMHLRPFPIRQAGEDARLPSLQVESPRLRVRAASGFDRIPRVRAVAIEIEAP